MKHITTVVEQHKAEVKDLEKNIEKLRQENDKPVARSSLDIDPLVDWYNSWLSGRQEDRREHSVDY